MIRNKYTSTDTCKEEQELQKCYKETPADIFLRSAKARKVNLTCTSNNFSMDNVFPKKKYK